MEFRGVGLCGLSRRTYLMRIKNNLAITIKYMDVSHTLSGSPPDGEPCRVWMWVGEGDLFGYPGRGFGG